MTYERQMLEHLNKRLLEREESVKDSLVGSGAKDFAEYKNLCGVIQGLRLAKMEIQDLVQRYEEFEDE